MTVVTDTAAKINAHNGKVTEVIGDKDALTLELAQQVDDSVQAITAKTEALTTTQHELEVMTQNRNTLQTQFNEYKTKYPPTTQPPVTPPTTAFKTKFGLGGGNVQRTGIDLDRRYYGPSDKAKAIADVNTNEGKGITTWLSFKCPFSWSRMAAGEGNAWAKDLFTGLINEVKPAQDDADKIDEVWVSIHHEPEGDDDEDLWRQFQGQLAPLVPGGPAGPLKYFLTTTGWGQEFNANRVAEEVDWETNLFPTDQAKFIYGIGYDAPYNTYGKIYKAGVATGEVNNKVTDPFIYVDALARRGVQFGVEVAIGEWGYSDEMFAKDGGLWAQQVMDRCRNNPIKQLRGAAYFDTKLNSSHSWYLGDATSAKRKHHMTSSQ